MASVSLGVATSENFTYKRFLEAATLSELFLRWSRTCWLRLSMVKVLLAQQSDIHRLLQTELIGETKENFD